jgi:uncharacterized protein (TIGR03435 family)
VDRTVLDRTGLTGQFDFTVEWAIPLDPAESLSRPVNGDPLQPLDVALRQQLGLTLRATKAAVDALVIDHIERPEEN